jgi:hypothetical protein
MSLNLDPKEVDKLNIPQSSMLHQSFNITPVVKHNHYFKDVSKLSTIDVYRVLSLFTVTDPCIQHAIKKLLVAGGRGAGKDIDKDIQEAIDSLIRYQKMKVEDRV